MGNKNSYSCAEKNPYLHIDGECLMEFPEKDFEREKIIVVEVAKKILARLTSGRISELVFDLSTENFPLIQALLQAPNHQFSEEERSVDPMLLKMELRKHLDSEREYKDRLLAVIEEKNMSQSE